MQKGKSYDINQCALYKVQRKKRLEELLSLKPGELAEIIGCAEYHPFYQMKKDGTLRKVSAPCPRLKQVQGRIHILLSKVEKPEWVFSATKGKCHIDNGKYHEYCSVMLNMDIAGFYENCTREYVYQFFWRKMKMSQDCAKALTDLCIYEGHIPTGAPTSQIVAYFAYQDMFQEIDEVVRSRGCKFSLFVDDLTVSSKTSFSPAGLENQINLILKRYGHHSKARKTHYSKRNDYKLTTGVAISPNNELKAPNSLQQRIMGDFEEYQLQPTDEMKLSMIGRIQAANMIEKDRFPFMRNSLERDAAQHCEL